MKTREEVEALKANWLKDPCWDIEDTDGFEEYAVELAGYHVEHRARWEAALEKAAADAYRHTPAGEATLRDMFAAHALSVMIADDEWDSTWLAARSYLIADAMMAERKKTPALPA